MAAISLKSIFIWFSNILLPFVILLNLPDEFKQDIRQKVELFTSNAKILYFFLLCFWVVVNLLLLWRKYETGHEALKTKKADRQKAEIELQIKQEELKRLKNDNN